LAPVARRGRVLRPGSQSSIGDRRRPPLTAVGLIEQVLDGCLVGADAGRLVDCATAAARASNRRDDDDDRSGARRCTDGAVTRAGTRTHTRLRRGRAGAARRIRCRSARRA
jgi:hypothetical protein